MIILLFRSFQSVNNRITEPISELKNIRLVALPTDLLRFVGLLLFDYFHIADLYDEENKENVRTVAHD